MRRNGFALLCSVCLQSALLFPDRSAFPDQSAGLTQKGSFSSSEANPTGTGDRRRFHRIQRNKSRIKGTTRGCSRYGVQCNTCPVLIPSSKPENDRISDDLFLCLSRSKCGGSLQKSALAFLALFHFPLWPLSAPLSECTNRRACKYRECGRLCNMLVSLQTTDSGLNQVCRGWGSGW